MINARDSECRVHIANPNVNGMNSEIRAISPSGTARTFSRTKDITKSRNKGLKNLV